MLRVCVCLSVAKVRIIFYKCCLLARFSVSAIGMTLSVLVTKNSSKLNYIEFLPHSAKNASNSLLSFVETWFFTRLFVSLQNGKEYAVQKACLWLGNVRALDKGVALYGVPSPAARVHVFLYRVAPFAGRCSTARQGRCVVRGGAGVGLLAQISCEAISEYPNVRPRPSADADISAGRNEGQCREPYDQESGRGSSCV